MARFCAVRGCGKQAVGYSRYCNRHKIARDRHGDAEQQCIRVADLKPHKRYIKKWIAKRKNADAIWAGMRHSWAKCVWDAEAELRAIAEHGGGISWRRWAYEDIVKIASDVDRDEIILTVVAVAYLAAYEPRAFKSDRAVRFQMARRFRALSDINVAEYYSHEDGKVHRVYRPPSPRHSEFLGQTLMAALGVHGIAICAKWQTEYRKAQEALTRTLSAIEEAA